MRVLLCAVRILGGRQFGAIRGALVKHDIKLQKNQTTLNERVHSTTKPPNRELDFLAVPIDKSQTKQGDDVKGRKWLCERVSVETTQYECRECTPETRLFEYTSLFVLVLFQLPFIVVCAQSAKIVTTTTIATRDQRSQQTSSDNCVTAFRHSSHGCNIPSL